MARTPEQKNNLTNGLDELITDLILDSMNSSYTAAEQDRLNRNAIAIRRKKLQLDSMTFDAETPGYKEAESRLKAVTVVAQTSIGKIDDLITFFGDLAKLASALDTLIAAARPL